MGAASTKAVKTEILKEMGLDAEKLKLIKDDVYGKYINDVKLQPARSKAKSRWAQDITAGWDRLLNLLKEL